MRSGPACQAARGSLYSRADRGGNFPGMMFKTQYPRLFLPESLDRCGEAARGLYEYWDRKRGTRFAPARADLDWFEMAAWRPGIVIVECGTTTSTRGRGRERLRNSFNLITLGARRIEIAHFMYFEPAQEFLVTSRHIYPRAACIHLGSDAAAQVE